MTALINTQTNSMGVVNFAAGNYVSDATTAAAATFTLGFAPRYIRFVNLTDRIQDEWCEGVIENSIFISLRGINAKLDAETGVTDTDFAALWNPASNDLSVMRASLVGMLAKLDADAGVTDTNYSALWKPGAADAVTLRASIAGMNAKLDADGTVTATDYAATWNVSAAPSLHTAATGATTWEVTNGIAVSGNTFSVTATTLVASKMFFWQAFS